MRQARTHPSPYAGCLSPPCVRSAGWVPAASLLASAKATGDQATPNAWVGRRHRVHVAGHANDDDDDDVRHILRQALGCGVRYALSPIVTMSTTRTRDGSLAPLAPVCLTVP